MAGRKNACPGSASLLVIAALVLRFCLGHHCSYSQSFIVLVKLTGSSFLASASSFVVLNFFSARITNRFFLLLILRRGFWPQNSQSLHLFTSF